MCIRATERKETCPKPPKSAKSTFLVPKNGWTLSCEDYVLCFFITWNMCLCEIYLYTYLKYVHVCVHTCVYMPVCVWKREIHKVPMKLGACGADRSSSTQQTLHLVHQISSPLLIGGGRVTSCSQWNVRSDLSHFQVEALKSSCKTL